MLVISLCVSQIAACPLARSATFTPVGDLPGGEFRSVARAVSGHGLTVVGDSAGPLNDSQAFIWSALQGMAALPLGPLGEIPQIARSTNGDGSVIVGATETSAGFRWTLGAGTELPGIGGAQDTSTNGDVAVGRTEAGQAGEPYRWVEGVGLTDLGVLPAPFDEGSALGVSAAGTSVAGVLWTAAPFVECGFLWTAAGGFTCLEPIPAFSGSAATAVSGGGATVVGVSRDSGNDGEATTWTAEGTATGLGQLSGGAFSSAIDVSFDGSIVVGSAVALGVSHAVIWTPAGLQTLADVLADAGIDLGGWQLRSALGISDDGQTIVGQGTNPDGLEEGWIVQLSFLCTGDVDGDMDSDVFDFGILSTFFGQLVAPGTLGDLDCDGDVDVFDFGVFAADFGCGS